MSENSYIRSYGFTKMNLWLLLGALALIVIGYILLSGGQSQDGVSFDPEVFSARRVIWAPVVLTLGYFGVVLAVIFRQRSKDEER